MKSFNINKITVTYRYIALFDVFLNKSNATVKLIQ